MRYTHKQTIGYYIVWVYKPVFMNTRVRKYRLVGKQILEYKDILPK